MTQRVVHELEVVEVEEGERQRLLVGRRERLVEPRLEGAPFSTPVSASVVDALCSPATSRPTCVFSMKTRAATTPIAVTVSRSMIRPPSSTGTQKASATAKERVA
jgi:hypothetical protein